jgi:RNA polymerase sigma-70 factor (ECF subfamily)
MTAPIAAHRPDPRAADLTLTTQRPAPEALRTPRRAEDLIERLLRRERGAFEEVVRLYQEPMIKLALDFVQDLAAAEEVVQDTWIGVLRGLHRFEHRASFKTWLFRILLNRARTRGKRDARLVSFSRVSAEPAVIDALLDANDDGEQRWSAPARRDPERDLRRKQARAILRDALDALPEQQRAVVAMRDLEDADFRDICDALQISPANQRVLLHRGRARLRQHLLDGLGDAI